MGPLQGNVDHRPVTSVQRSCATFEPRTLAELLRASQEQLESCDLARMALLCAEGLPGAEDVGVTKYLRILDAWVVRIRATLVASDHLFDDNPAKYDFSRARFKMWLAALALSREFGVHYRRDRIGKTHAVMPDQIWYQDSRDFMLHGVLGRNRSGTCASMPALLASVARRLGFPVYIALTHLHMFCRWDDPITGEIFNFDWNGDGVSSHPDDYYQRWPVQWTDQMHADNRRRKIYLKSCAPTQILATLLCERAICLETYGRLDEALEAWEAGDRFFPEHPGFAHRADRIRWQICSDAVLDSIQGAWPSACQVWWGIIPPDRPGNVAPLHSQLLDREASRLCGAKRGPVNIVIHPIENTQNNYDLSSAFLQFPTTRRSDHVRPL